MPKYNELYKTLDQKIDWLTTVDVTTKTDSESQHRDNQKSTSKTTSTGEAADTSNTKSNNKSRAVASDFPQTQLEGSKDYATNAQDSVGEGTGESTGKRTEKGGSDSTGDTTADGSASGNVLSHVKGYNASPSSLLNEYRTTIINVDEMVMLELEPLFMMVLNNGDDYTGRTAYYGYGYGY